MMGPVAGGVAEPLYHFFDFAFTFCLVLGSWMPIGFGREQVGSSQDAGARDEQ